MAAPPRATTMRFTMMTLASLSLLLAAPALATANISHDGCGESDVSVRIVDVWTTQCAGAVFNQPPCFGMTRHQDVPLGDATLHALLLSGWGCQTGVILEP